MLRANAVVRFRTLGPFTPSLAISRRTIAFRISGVLAHELTILRATEVALTLEMINARPRVDPHKLVTRARHARWRMVNWRLSES